MLWINTPYTLRGLLPPFGLNKKGTAEKVVGPLIPCRIVETTVIGGDGSGDANSWSGLTKLFFSRDIHCSDKEPAKDKSSDCFPGLFAKWLAQSVQANSDDLGEIEDQAWAQAICACISSAGTIVDEVLPFLFFVKTHYLNCYSNRWSALV